MPYDKDVIWRTRCESVLDAGGGSAGVQQIYESAQMVLGRTHAVYTVWLMSEMRDTHTHSLPRARAHLTKQPTARRRPARAVP
jgi:hypothetical protein